MPTQNTITQTTKPFIFANVLSGMKSLDRDTAIGDFDSPPPSRSDESWSSRLVKCGGCEYWDNQPVLLRTQACAYG
jgi:hypothetical protein